MGVINYDEHLVPSDPNEYYRQNSQPKVMLCDFDNVITFSDLVVCNLLFKNKDKFGKYLKVDNPFTLKDVYSRNTYYLTDWLKRDDIDKVPDDIIHDVSSLYGHPDVYNSEIVKFTQFSVILARRIVKSNSCKAVYILTANINPMQDRLKQNLLMEFFDKEDLNKIEYASANGGVKKSKLVNDMGIKWDSFADDYLENTYDLLKNSNGFGNEILIPKYGFNEPDEKASTIFYAFNAQVYYMEENLNRTTI